MPRRPSEFTRAKEVIRGLESAEQAHRRDVNRKCDWEDPKDVLEYRRQRRMKKRAERVKRYSRAGKCPVCAGTVHDLKLWVIGPDYVCCRKCHGTPLVRAAIELRREWRQTGNPKAKLDFGEFFKELMSMPKAKTHPREIFSLPPQERFVIDNESLEEARELSGLSKSAFADKCGWSRVYQQKLENGVVKTVDRQCAETMLRVLMKADTLTKDTVVLPHL